jgi:hypothetical protein
MAPSEPTRLDTKPHRWQLHHIQSHYQTFATKAAEQQRSQLDYLAQLVEGAATMRESGTRPAPREARRCRPGLPWHVPGAPSDSPNSCR